MTEEHYWLCEPCAESKGGIFPAGHTCTVMLGKCPYCKKKQCTLIPWVDFNWPKDKVKDKTAKANRD